MAPGTWRIMSAELRTRGLFDLKRATTAAIKREGQPAVAAARAAWLGVEVSSSKGGHVRPDNSTGLRARVAAATQVQVTTTGIRIVVVASKVGPYGRTLPWYLGGYGRPWRHPIFGRRANSADWTVERGQRVFFSTILAHEPAFRAAIAQAMEEAARQF